MVGLLYPQRACASQDAYHCFKGYLEASLRFCVGLGMVK